MVELTNDQEVYINKVTTEVPLLTFNYDSGTFDVSENEPTWDVIKNVYKAVEIFRSNPIPSPHFNPVRVNQIQLGYYNRCLEHYCYERLNLGISHEQTCWIRYASKTYCLGRIDPSAKFDDIAIKLFMESLNERKNDFIAMSIYKAYRRKPNIVHDLKKDEEGWLMFCSAIPIEPLGKKDRIKDFCKNSIKKTIGYDKGKRILKLIENIRINGWDNNLAKKPLCGVLGYSRKTKCYQVFTGKHRIAALKYLYSQGEISGSTFIEYPVITYPWGPWRHGRPHPDSPVCERCKV